MNFVVMRSRSAGNSVNDHPSLQASLCSAQDTGDSTTPASSEESQASLGETTESIVLT